MDAVCPAGETNECVFETFKSYFTSGSAFRPFRHVARFVVEPVFARSFNSRESYLMPDLGKTETGFVLPRCDAKHWQEISIRIRCSYLAATTTPLPRY